MKQEELERLEESQEIQQLIRLSKAEYECEKAEQPPLPYATLRQRMRQESRRSRRVPAWWLAAACLLGCLMGYGLSGRQDVEPPRQASEQVAVVDTVVIVRERVDTVYRERQPREWIAGKQSSSDAPKAPVSSSEKGKAKEKREEPRRLPDYYSPRLLEQEMRMPDPNSDCYAANGMNVAQENYPLHLLATVPR